MKKQPPKLVVTHLLTEWLRSSGLPVPDLEYRFCRRRWRFDLAWPSLLLAVEIDGGVWIQGRHTRGKGYENDCEKLNTAQEMGWKVLRYTPGMIRRGLAFPQLEKLLAP